MSLWLRKRGDEKFLFGACGKDKRISATTWIGEQVLLLLFFLQNTRFREEVTDSDHFQDHVAGEVTKEVFGDHVKWKGVMRTLFSGHMDR
jgi:hypothetical protein